MSVRSIHFGRFGSTKTALIFELCLGMIILFGSSEETTPMSSSTIEKSNIMNTIYCDVLSFSKVYCGVNSKQTNVVPTIPVDNFPKQMKTLDANFMPAAGWKVKDERMFQNFENLTEIRLTGPVQFSAPYSDEPSKTKLMNELFNVSKLESLNILYWDLREFSSWKFPASLKTLMVQKCALAQLDLSSNPNLIALNLVSNFLQKMPTLSDPLPPLEILVLSNNPNIKFTVEDIATLCHLKQLGITQFNSQLSPIPRYCECVRLKDYMMEFGIVEYDPLTCDGPASANFCSNYTLEFVRSIHVNRCSNFTSTTLTEFSNSESNPFSNWFQQNKIALGIGALLMLSLIANLVLFVFAAKSGGGPGEWDPSGYMVEEEGAET